MARPTSLPAGRRALKTLTAGVSGPPAVARWSLGRYATDRLGRTRLSVPDAEWPRESTPEGRAVRTLSARWSGDRPATWSTPRPDPPRHRGTRRNIGPKRHNLADKNVIWVRDSHKPCQRGRWPAFRQIYAFPSAGNRQRPAELESGTRRPLRGRREGKAAWVFAPGPSGDGHPLRRWSAPTASRPGRTELARVPAGRATAPR